MGKITTLTPEEVALVAKSPSDELREAIAKTDSDKLVESFDQFTEMYRGIDFYLRGWVTTALTVLYEHAGPEAVQEAWLKIGEPLYSCGPDTFWEMNFHDRVMSAINGLRYSLNASICVMGEDDEKIWFALNPCTTGVKLLNAGVYEGATGCSMCSAHEVTGGVDHFPIYCTHNPGLDIACVKATGCLHQLTDFADEVATCACTYVIYKRKEDIPEKYYTRIGAKKPE